MQLDGDRLPRTHSLVQEPVEVNEGVLQRTSAANWSVITAVACFCAHAAG